MFLSSRKLLPSDMFFVLFLFNSLLIWLTQKQYVEANKKAKLFFYTLVPNIFMFGLIFGILIILPGWKAPFANTIGYAIIKTMGVSDLLRKMIKSAADLKKSTTDKGATNQSDQGGAKPLASSPTPITYAGGGRRKRRGTRKRLLQHGGAPDTKREQATEMRVEMKEILKYIDRDPSLLINEITPNNWDTWMNKTALPKLFKPEYTKNKNHEDIEKLYNLVSLRDLVGEYIWLILAGFLVITTQTNALYSINCKGESSEVEKQLQEKWAKTQAKLEGTKKKMFFTRE